MWRASRILCLELSKAAELSVPKCVKHTEKGSCDWIWQICRVCRVICRICRVCRVRHSEGCACPKNGVWRPNAEV